MTYITVTEDMRLVPTKMDTIYRGDNLSKKITFLLPTEIDGVAISDSTTIFLSYIRADGEPDMVTLQRESAMYSNSWYQYIIPVTCRMSKYAGQICLWLQICSGDTANPTISKTGECIIKIRESKNMDDYLCDHQLTALYQMKKKIDNIIDDSSDEDCSWSDMESTDNHDSGTDEWENM